MAGEVHLAMNCTSNRVTKFSPLELLQGKEARPLGMLSLNENEKNAVSYRGESSTVGDSVLFESKAFTVD